jgi:hypothetical protein
VPFRIARPQHEMAVVNLAVVLRAQRQQVARPPLPPASREELNVVQL